MAGTSRTSPAMTAPIEIPIGQNDDQKPTPQESTFSFRLSEFLLECPLSAKRLSGGGEDRSSWTKWDPHRRNSGERANQGGKRKKAPGGSAEVLEKARFGQGNPRKSKRIPLLSLAGIRPGLARFGIGLDGASLKRSPTTNPRPRAAPSPSPCDSSKPDRPRSGQSRRHCATAPRP